MAVSTIIIIIIMTTATTKIPEEQRDKLFESHNKRFYINAYSFFGFQQSQWSALTDHVTNVTASLKFKHDVNHRFQIKTKES